jgi:sugar phosphate isomerase/epimerase
VTARGRLEELQKVAEPLGVQLALEVVPNELSRAGSCPFRGAHGRHRRSRICLDFGHAHMDGDLVEAIETVSEHLVAVDVHDNRGRADDHLVPFEGTIDWAAALTAVQKVGYDQPLMLEIGGRGPAKETLARARQARQKMERLLAL